MNERQRVLLPTPTSSRYEDDLETVVGRLTTTNPSAQEPPTNKLELDLEPRNDLPA